MTILRKILLALHSSRRQHAAREMSRYAHLIDARKPEKAAAPQDCAQEKEAPAMDRVALLAGGYA